MPPIDALQKLQRDLIRKASNGSVFIAKGDAPAIDETTLFDATSGDLKAAGLPEDYEDVGLTTDAGAQFARSVSTSDVSSWQSRTPSRTDITEDSTTLQYAAQETKLVNIGLYLGIDIDTVEAGSNGVVRIDQPEVAADLHYRALMIAVDETAEGEFVVCRFMPSAKVTSYDNQSYAKGDDPILWPVTMTGYKDDTLGTSHSWIFGGAGFKARLAAMGFATA